MPRLIFRQNYSRVIHFFGKELVRFHLLCPRYFFLLESVLSKLNLIKLRARLTLKHWYRKNALRRYLVYWQPSLACHTVRKGYVRLKAHISKTKKDRVKQTNNLASFRWNSKRDHRRNICWNLSLAIAGQPQRKCSIFSSPSKEALQATESA